jgi:hypothetical protein
MADDVLDALRDARAAWRLGHDRAVRSTRDATRCDARRATATAKD